MSEINDVLIDALRQRQQDNLNPDGSSQAIAWPFDSEDFYPACVSPAKSMKSLSIGGFATDSDLVAVIILSDFFDDATMPQTWDDLNLSAVAPAIPAVPIPKQSISYGGKRYRIDATNIPPGLAFISLALTDWTKGV